MLEADHLTLEGGVEGLVSAIIFSSTDSNFFSSQRAAHDFKLIHIYTNTMSRRLLTGKKLAISRRKNSCTDQYPTP